MNKCIYLLAVLLMSHKTIIYAAEPLYARTKKFEILEKLE